MRLKNLILCQFLFSSLALAAPKTQAPHFDLRAEPKPGDQLVLKAQAPDAHHFNLKAPISLQIEGEKSLRKPTTTGAKELSFQIPSPPADSLTVKYTVTAYLCDNANTFCERHRMIGEWRQADFTLKVKPDESSSAGDAKDAFEKLGASAKTDDHGFLVNQTDLAFEQARASKKPVMIDFFGIWCPPCNQYDEKVFSTPEFSKASERFVRLKIDADAEGSWKLKSKYKVGGYPTILFVSDEGEEISRVVGFRDLDLFLSEMNRAYEKKEFPFSVLRKKADRGDAEAAQSVGLTYLERKEYAPALEYLSKSSVAAQKSPEKIAEAKLGVIQAKVEGGEKAALAEW
jgi:thiol-disulfide isomerase/thioredoxin